MPQVSRYMGSGMSSIEVWAAFVAASTVLLIIPGPTALFVVSYTLAQGWHAALPMAVGVALGDFTAMTFSMLGVGAGIRQALHRAQAVRGCLFDLAWRQAVASQGDARCRAAH